MVGHLMSTIQTIHVAEWSCARWAMAGLLEFCSRCVLENIEVRSAAVIPRHLRPTDDLWIGVAEGTRLYPVLNIATVQKRLTLAFLRADEATNPPATSGMMSRDAMSAGPNFVGTGCEWKQRRDERAWGIGANTMENRPSRALH